MIGNVEGDRRKTHDAAQPGADELVAHALSCLVRCGDDADGRIQFTAGDGQFLGAAHDEIPDSASDSICVTVEESDHLETAAAESAVADQCLAEVSDSDENDLVPTIESECTLDADAEPVDVADPTPDACASSSLETMEVPRSDITPRTRRYAAKRVTVAWGMTRS